MQPRRIFPLFSSTSDVRVVRVFPESSESVGTNVLLLFSKNYDQSFSPFVKLLTNEIETNVFYRSTYRAIKKK